MNKRLLIITHHKLNENNGGCNASKGFVHCLASLFDECAIISPEIHPTEPYIPKDFKYYPLHDTRSKARKFFDMYRGRISGLYYAVKEHLKNHRYDVVVIDHSFSGAGISSYIKSTEPNSLPFITMWNGTICVIIAKSALYSIAIPSSIFLRKRK